ncbi:MAG: haloacid dehalogenase type II [Janthinobacterium lividum]
MALDATPPVRALLFDVFGTVVDWRASLVRHLEAFGRERGLDADWTGLVDAWRGAYRPSMDRVRRGELPWTVLDDLHRFSLATLSDERGLGLDDAALDRLALLWRELDPWPDTLPGLSRLRARFTLAPLSNGNVALLVAMAKRAGLPWDMVFGTDLFGHYKPDPQTYLGACRLLRLEPAEVMLVAAHNSDLAAARALGLRTGFVARPTEYGPAQTADLRAEQDWDVTAASLEALADSLGA